MLSNISCVYFRLAIPEGQAALGSDSLRFCFFFSSIFGFRVFHLIPMGAGAGALKLLLWSGANMQ